MPSLAIPRKIVQPAPSVSESTGAEATSSLVAAMAGENSGDESGEADISDAKIPMREIPRDELPQCPKCQKDLLRPGVVWFEESLPKKTLTAVNKFVTESQKIDLMLVIGTSAKVFPAASYIDAARHKGAKVAVINMDRADGASGLCEGDWFFEGDAAQILPEILESVIGDISAVMTAGNS